MDTKHEADTSVVSNASTGLSEYGDGTANSPTTKRRLLDKIQVTLWPAVAKQSYR